MLPKNRHFSCAVIGDWHLAFVQAACLSALGHKVVLVNPKLDPKKTWDHFPKPPVTEPGLVDLMSKGQAEETLDFANGVDSDWTADLVWLAVDTPVNDLDEPDTSPLILLASQVARHKKALGPFVISSQVPLGFCSKLEENYPLKVVYIPENLRLGKGIETFLGAERTVLGASLLETRNIVQEFLKGLKTEFVLCDLPTSEMIKHATNVFLATSISFANELARLGETMGVDNAKVAQALKLDKRIGKLAYVAPGLGFAGGTLPRDLRVLQKLGREKKLKTPLVDAVLEINETTAQSLVHFIRNHEGTLSDKHILILGYTYKADTDTLRRSYSIEMAKKFAEEGAKVFGFDPVMNHHDLSLLKDHATHVADWEELNTPLDAILVMTPRKEFLDLPWAQVSSGKPLILDAHNFLSAKKMLDLGFNYKALWQPIQAPKEFS